MEHMVAPRRSSSKRSSSAKMVRRMPESWILAAGLEAAGFETNVAFGDCSGDQSEHTGEQTLHSQGQGCPAACRGRLDGMVTGHSKPRCGADPGKAPPALDLGDLPQGR